LHSEKKEDKKEFDLSTIISSALAQEREFLEMRERKKEIIDKIKRNIALARISADDLLNYADSLLIISAWEESRQHLTECLRTRFFVILIYFLLNDEKHLSKVVKLFDKTIEKVKNEALTWKDYDKAYLFETIKFLRDFLISTFKVMPGEVDYITKVHPLIRDVPRIMVLSIKGELSSDAINKKFGEFEKFAKEHNLLEQWQTVREIYEVLRACFMMRGAVSDTSE